MILLLWLMLAINFSMVTANVTAAPPVLIWGTDAPESETIFRPLKTDQFTKIMMKIQKKHMIAVYLASELAAKDINCPQCFPSMRLIQPVHYYSQVEEPVLALDKVSEETKPIIWHNPVLTDKSQLALEMELPCDKGRIHCFNFSDRNFLDHDSAMAASYYQFTDCPVVHVYTAFTEESKAYLRRKAQSNKPDLAGHVTFSESSNLTILRREAAVFAFRHIMLANRESGKFPHFSRSNVSLIHSDKSMQLGMHNGQDVQAGMVLILDTDVCPLVIELLPVRGNWYLTRGFCGNRTYYPRDLIFFDSGFSLCCHHVTLFGSDLSILSLFNFHLDIITSSNDNGMDAKYEAKPCWSCSQLMSSTLTQAIVVMLFFMLVLWIGMSFITSIGRNQLVQVAGEPDLHIKADL